jgi:membrane fusion protein, heavy metal efflux system
MKPRLPHLPPAVLWPAVLVLILVIGWLTWPRWGSGLASGIERTIAVFRGETAATVPDADHEAHEHDHADHGHEHDAAESLHLSPQAMRNIGLTADALRPVELSTFRRSITLPGVVVERPGRTRVEVATPMTGVVTHVHAVQGEAVEPGTLLFQIRLTHEDLVAAQTDFLKALGELDVEEREIQRLSEVTRSGAVAGNVLLERQYARDKLTALLDAQREALRLHGLSQEQVDRIASERRLLRELQVFAPSADDHSEDELRLSGRSAQPVSLLQDENAEQNEGGNAAEPAGGGAGDESPLILQQLDVHKGQAVTAGETLCVLADYSLLFIEGQAFAQDVAALREASRQDWPVEAIFEAPGAASEVVEELEIAYLSNEIDPQTRTLHVYVLLPNDITSDRTERDNRYVQWRYRPGQRLQLRIPVEEWTDQIVLPVEAVAREGAESFVFQQNGDHFDRVPVHVKYQDQQVAVIANDGSLFPGDVVARRGAHQMQMTLQNQAGGAVDPHAGHSH